MLFCHETRLIGVFPSYGKVTFEVSSPLVPGVVTAVILIGIKNIFTQTQSTELTVLSLANEHDEIDVELLGGDPAHWQTNIFVPEPKDAQPLWGVFSSIESVPAEKSSGGSIKDFHKYSIDWNSERIIWGVDGKSVRTLTKGS